MKAKKENKVYRITTDEEKQRYLKAGFDIYDDDGNLTEYSPLKKIEYGKYEELEKKNAGLQEKIGHLEKENAGLREMVAHLEKENTGLQKKISAGSDKKEATKKDSVKAGE